MSVLTLSSASSGTVESTAESGMISASESNFSSSTELRALSNKTKYTSVKAFISRELFNMCMSHRIHNR